MSTLTQQLKALALEQGFVRAGVARVTPLDAEAKYFREWLAAGHHGSMQYLADTAEVRVELGHARMFEGARSVIALATSYARAPNPALGALAPGRLARYAHGRDYHPLLYDRTRPLKRLLAAQGHRARATVDTMPALERAWASRAGLGFIGKNACLIVPGVGSHVLLSLIVTDAELDADAPIEERCGQCRLCLDACPTRAFVAERQLDARRCISYLTIEHEGEIEPELREPMGAWLFGCDECQDVCPYNRTRPVAEALTEPFAPRLRSVELGAEDLLRMDDAVFERYSRGMPMRRAGREGMARNAAIVLGNAGDKRHLPLLEDRAQHDPSPVVRDAAAWAKTRLDKRLA
jgi:epoxyqueuosine reductase